MKMRSLIEAYYDSLKPVEGYMDADDLIGKRLWAHTNRTHRNQGKNGMIGLYGTTPKGTRKGSPLYYTNAIRLSSPIVFQVAGGSAVDSIKKSGKRTLVAGVSGTVVKTREASGASGFKEIVFKPFGDAQYFHVKGDPDNRVDTADEVFFTANEGGKWMFLAENPRSK